MKMLDISGILWYLLPIKFSFGIIHLKGEYEMSIKYNVIIQKEENWYVAKCLDNNVASQGKSIEEALKNLKEAIELYNENDIKIEVN